VRSLHQAYRPGASPSIGRVTDALRSGGSYAEAIQQDLVPDVDVQHGLHLQRVIESAETEALRGT
jgi:hypothetical protein